MKWDAEHSMLDEPLDPLVEGRETI